MPDSPAHQSRIREGEPRSLRGPGGKYARAQTAGPETIRSGGLKKRASDDGCRLSLRVPVSPGPRLSGEILAVF